MKALIINIDHTYRSVYSGSIVASLLKKIPSLEITGLISSPNDLLETTGHFKKIHFFDTEAFFNGTKNLTNNDIEKALERVLAPVKDTKWDVVINLSSNLLGCLMLNFLNAKEVRGTSLDQNLANFKHSDLSSFYLSQIPDDFSNYFHFTYLYRSMLKRFEEITLTSVLEGKMAQEFVNYFENLKKKNGKSEIVLIDSNLTTSQRPDEIMFVTNLFQKFQEDKKLLPILIGPDLDESHPLMRKLQETVKGEIYALSSENQAQLSLVGIASLVITDSLYLKSVADISMKPSILISQTMNLSDYSIIDGSYQIVSKRVGDLAEAVYELTQPELSTSFKDLDIYKTIISQNLPVLVPVMNGGTIEYADWLLGVKFLAYSQKSELPSTIQVNPKNYKSALLKEKQMVGKKENRGIYAMAMEMSRAEIKNTKMNENQIVENLNRFLSTEESRL